MKSIPFRQLMLMAVLAFALAVSGCADSNSDDVTNPNPNPFHPVGDFQGYIKDAVTATPIEGAVVDVGYGKATTSATGQFVIRDIPANTDPCGCVDDEYEITIDLRNVNATIGTSGYQYPDFVWTHQAIVFTSLNDTTNDVSGTNSSNHDTPVDHLVSNWDAKIGKLAANICGVVAGCWYPVGAFDPNAPGSYTGTGGNTPDFFVGEAGATVSLIATGNSLTGGNGGTGDLGNVIQTTTTGTDGSFCFDAPVQVMQSFRVTAKSSDGSRTADSATQYSNLYYSGSWGSFSVTTAGEGTTLNLGGIQQSHALHVCSTDVHGPEVISALVEGQPSGSDIPADSVSDNNDTTSLTLTFSEAVKQNSSTSTDAGTIGNLYANTELYYTGRKVSFKGGNLAYTLSWNADFTALTYTFRTAPSGTYVARINNMTALFTDSNGQSGTMGVCQDDSDSKLTAFMGPLAPDAGQNDCTVAFSTSGVAENCEAPVLVMTNSTTLDQNDVEILGSCGDQDNATGMNFDWSPVSCAKGYNVYCEQYQVWTAGEICPTGASCQLSTPALLVNPLSGTPAARNPITFSDISIDPDDTTLWDVPSYVEGETGDIALQYRCWVVPVDSDGIEGPASNKVLGRDQIKPRIVQIGAPLTDPIDCSSGWTTCNTDGDITTLHVPFSEALDESNAETTTNWTIGVSGSNTAPVVSKAVYNRSPFCSTDRESSVDLTLNPALNPDLLTQDIHTGADGISNTWIPNAAAGETTVDLQIIEPGFGLAGQTCIDGNGDGLDATYTTSSAPFFSSAPVPATFGTPASGCDWVLIVDPDVAHPVISTPPTVGELGLLTTTYWAISCNVAISGEVLSGNGAQNDPGDSGICYVTAVGNDIQNIGRNRGKANTTLATTGNDGAWNVTSVPNNWGANPVLCGTFPTSDDCLIANVIYGTLGIPSMIPAPWGVAGLANDDGYTAGATVITAGQGVTDVAGNSVHTDADEVLQSGDVQ